MASRKDLYWAKEPDPQALVEDLCKRRDDFWTLLEELRFIESAYKLWRFYHGLFYDTLGGSVVAGGKEGDISQIGVNEYRSRLSLLLTYATTSDPDWDAQTAKTEQKALEATKRFNRILDYTMDAPQYSVRTALKTAAEHALIYRVGYVCAKWNEQLGDEVSGNPETLDIQRSGDIDYSNPTLFDVVFDPSYLNHKRRPWVFWRERVNKYDLAETFYSKRDDILAISDTRDQRRRFFGMEYGLTITDMEIDTVDRWYFLHLPTPAMKAGRYTCFAGDDIVLHDGACPAYYKRLPLHRIVHKELLATSIVGDSPAVHLAPIQEALNMQITTVLTNHKKFGQTKIWSKQGEDIDIQDMEPGSQVLQTNTEIKGLNLLQTSGDLLAFAKDLVAMMDSVSGVSAVSRGVMEKETSGIHAALLDMKTLQANQEFDKNYQHLCEAVGQATLDILQQKADIPREIPVVGENDRMRMEKFTKEDLVDVNRVLVKTGNAAMRTPAGKMNLANMLMQIPGTISNPRELISILEGAPLDRLVSAEDAQIRLANEENASLLRGESPTGSITDDHLYHIRSHTSEVIGSVNARVNPQLVVVGGAHVLWHLDQALRNPTAQALMVALGWATPDQLAALAATQPPPMPMPGEEQGGGEPQGGGGGQVIPMPQDSMGQAKQSLESSKDYLDNQAQGSSNLSPQSLGG